VVGAERLHQQPQNQRFAAPYAQAHSRCRQTGPCQGATG
jgi:hypothetical protein